MRDHDHQRPIGRALTPLERIDVARRPILAGAGTDTPTGPVHCVAEYEPMKAVPPAIAAVE